LILFKANQSIKGDIGVRSGFITKIVITIFVLILLSFLLFVFKYENNINATGKIVSANEWMLTKRPDGSIISILYDHKNNIVSNTQTFHVERGDIFGLNINPSILNKKYITILDTIGVIF
jgi:hypothetical protein